VAGSSELVLRPTTRADAPALVELFRACFGVDVAHEYFAWKYYENPAGEVVAFVADAGDRLAAFYGAIPELWNVGAADATVYQSMDMMTHPDFRRRGLFARLVVPTREEIRRRAGRCDQIGLPGPTWLPGFAGGLGWSLIHEFELLVVPTGVARAWPRHGDRRISVEAVAQPDERVHAVLSAAAKPAGRAWPRLEGAFFDWRVFGRSPKRLRVALASRGDQPTAVCVYGLTSPRTTLVSYVVGVEGDDPWQWFPALIRFIARHGAVLYTWRPQQAALEALYRSMAFRPNPLRRGPLTQRVPLVVRSDTGSVNGIPWADAALFDLQPLMQD
jgi:GNAT superfamily N-acetyltransferase